MLIATYQQRRPDGSNPPLIINSIDMQTMLRLIAADALDEVTAYLAAEIDKLVQAGAESVGGLITEFLPEVSHRDNGFGHRPVSSRTADV